MLYEVCSITIGKSELYVAHYLKARKLTNLAKRVEKQYAVGSDPQIAAFARPSSAGKPAGSELQRTLTIPSQCPYRKACEQNVE
jgi:hypothetical protein